VPQQAMALRHGPPPYLPPQAGEESKETPPMSVPFRKLASVCFGFAMVLVGMPQAHAQSVEQFYRGRSITMLVGTSPGGINDISARLVARHMGRFIPGNPAMVVQNNPGAGGLVTANRVYNTVERDGSVLAKFERAVPQLAIQGDPNAQFDPMKFTWLGSLSSYADDAYLLAINATNPVKSVAEIAPGGKSLNLGADSSASSNLIFALIAKEILGLNINIVRGYTGAATLFLAMARNEIDGQFVGLSSIKSGQRDLWNRRAFRALMAFGRTTRHPDFPEVPTGRELAKDANALALIDFAELPFFIALPFAAPPGVPADRAKALQDAFMAMCRDNAFREDALKTGIDMSPIDGAGVQQMLAKTAATPKNVIARYNAIGGERK
jgi:tripartite-type tricarboxylate transporter receptor subunit TctC